MKEIVAIAIDLLTAPFRKGTVTDVVKVLEGQVDKLFKISADRIATASTLRDKADVLHSQADEHEEEAERALRVAERFTNLIR
ncbi:MULTISPECIES: hypothetical protein [Stenotrophomonas maltophilia group]|uniref:hypothetical protein n=1 Tax=Stenotrophomonas maltophilia group TaxID=995085 RepID=UPI000DA8D821|nr:MULTISPECIES: hypothetical protein [Stenotrophomonas maltophilia group]MCZ7843209.1 hypothetical protein [Stenotrophomonas maltophilia]PZT41188.1 hypothetical protein A7X97_03615 [Stenotrophomonas sepilia]